MGDMDGGTSRISWERLRDSPELRVESTKNQLAHSISPEDEIFTERLTECLKDKMTVDSSLLVNYFDVHQSWIPNPFVLNHQMKMYKYQVGGWIGNKIGNAHPKTMRGLGHCAINELLKCFLFIYKKNTTRSLVTFSITSAIQILRVITCVILRLGCSLKTEFIKAILAALLRASALVGQVCDNHNCHDCQR